MTRNTLEIGDVPRLGWFFDGDPDTEQIAVMLRNTEAAIEMTIPLRGIFDESDSYTSWFAFDSNLGGGVSKSTSSKHPPRVLFFEDWAGPVVLLGCRVSGANLGMKNGQGKIVANYALLGARHPNYEKINGIRTISPGFSEWANLGHLAVSLIDQKSSNKTFSVSLPEQSEVQVSEFAWLKTLSDWSLEPSRGRFEARDQLVLESSYPEPTDWFVQLSFHKKLLDLASISAWVPFGYSQIYINRSDDPETNYNGDNPSQRWLSVKTHQLPSHRPWNKHLNFLFAFQEVGIRGIKKWLEITQDYSKPIDSVIYMLRSPEIWSRSNVIESGIALEALGYQINLHKHGVSPKKNISFRNCLNIVLSDLSITPFVDAEEWIDRAVDVYMGVKHINRTQQDAEVEINTYRENLLVLRLWIAQEIGVDIEHLHKKLQNDALMNEFTVSEF